MRIGLIGVGAIGGFLAERIMKDQALELGFVLDTDKEKAGKFPKGIAIDSIEEMPAKKPDLVVEAASAEAVKQYAESVLGRADLMIMSVSALADKAFEEKVKKVCGTNGTRLFVPSGAIAGIDMLRAMQAELKEVILVSRKNPRGWGRSDSAETVIFEGSAREACRLYPKNVNISATISLNGIGFDRTMVKLISDPACEANRHTLLAKHSSGEMELDVRAFPSKNPRTSSTAAYSALDLIKKIQGGINVY